MKRFMLALAMVILLSTKSYGADITLRWDASQGATGYKLYMRTDLGATWPVSKDAGNVLTFMWTEVPETGLVLFRVSAYNDVAESITTDKGAWYNHGWSEPEKAYGLGAK